MASCGFIKRISVRLLLVDNYDSFTWNLAALFVGAGAEVQVVRNDAVAVGTVLGSGVAGVVIGPGPNAPVDAGICLDLVRACAGRLPLFGVCLGHQAAAAAFGGRIVRAPRPVHGKVAQMAHDGSGAFSGLASPLSAMRYHSLVVDPTSVPVGMTVSAWLDDGPEHLVMGLRDAVRGIESVQFHPESVGTAHGPETARNILDWMTNWRRQR
jgi:anthranilate synthase component 2